MQSHAEIALKLTFVLPVTKKDLQVFLLCQRKCISPFLCFISLRFRTLGIKFLTKTFQNMQLCRKPSFYLSFGFDTDISFLPLEMLHLLHICTSHCPHG